MKDELLIAYEWWDGTWVEENNENKDTIINVNLMSLCEIGRTNYVLPNVLPDAGIADLAVCGMHTHPAMRPATVGNEVGQVFTVHVHILLQ